MKRGKGLARRTGLRTTKGLAPGKGLEPGPAPARRTLLRTISAKQRAINTERASALAALLAAHPICQFPGCATRSTDGHELLRRSQGGDARRPDLALCRPHHDWIGSHPADAVAMGLAVWRWRGTPS